MLGGMRKNMSESEREQELRYLNNPPIFNYINDKLLKMRRIEILIYDHNYIVSAIPSLIRSLMDSLPPQLAAEVMKKDYDRLVAYERNTSVIRTRTEMLEIYKRVVDWSYKNLFLQTFNPLRSKDFEELEDKEK